MSILSDTGRLGERDKGAVDALPDPTPFVVPHRWVSCSSLLPPLLAVTVVLPPQSSLLLLKPFSGEDRVLLMYPLGFGVGKASRSWTAFPLGLRMGSCAGSHSSFCCCCWVCCLVTSHVLLCSPFLWRLTPRWGFSLGVGEFGLAAAAVALMMSSLSR